jgi:hypothetical protein
MQSRQHPESLMVVQQKAPNYYHEIALLASLIQERQILRWLAIKDKQSLHFNGIVNRSFPDFNSEALGILPKRSNSEA